MINGNTSSVDSSQTVMADLASTPSDEAQQVAQWQAAYGEVLAAYIALIKSHGGLIPELVSGSTLADVQASAEIAQAAYQRIMAELNSQSSAETTTGAQSQDSAPPAMPNSQPSQPPFQLGAGGGSRSSGLAVGREQQQGKRPDPTALVMQYYSSGVPRR